MPFDEVLGAANERAEISRREFLATAGAAWRRAGRVAGSGLLRPHRATASDPRIVIVGAGLAGVRCAHQLWVDGAAAGRPIASTIYEADTTHIGGRCWSLRDFFAGGTVAEHGGSFLNTGQRRVRRLAKSLGLAEEVVRGGDLRAGEEVFYVGGAPYSEAEASADWATFGFDAFHDGGGRRAGRRTTAHPRPRVAGSTTCRCRSGSTKPVSARQVVSVG